MHGLMAICHAAGNGWYRGSHWPKHARAVFLPDIAHRRRCPAVEGHESVRADLDRRAGGEGSGGWGVRSFIVIRQEKSIRHTHLPFQNGFRILRVAAVWKGVPGDLASATVNGCRFRPRGRCWGFGTSTRNRLSEACADC